MGISLQSVDRASVSIFPKGRRSKTAEHVTNLGGENVFGSLNMLKTKSTFWKLLGGGGVLSVLAFLSEVLV